MNPVYVSLNRMPTIWSLPWLHFCIVILVTVVSMPILTGIFGLVGLLVSFIIGALLYLALYALSLADRVKYYGMLERTVKKRLTSLGETGQSILLE
jgi:hypothetical protein